MPQPVSEIFTATSSASDLTRILTCPPLELNLTAFDKSSRTARQICVSSPRTSDRRRSESTDLVGFDEDTDMPALGIELDRVRQKLADGKADMRFVAAHVRPAAQRIDGDRHLLGVGRLAHPFDLLVDEGDDIENAGRDLRGGSGAEMHEVENAADEGQHLLAARLNLPEQVQRFRIVRSRRRRFENGGKAKDMIERRAQ